MNHSNKISSIAWIILVIFILGMFGWLLYLSASVFQKSTEQLVFPIQQDHASCDEKFDSMFSIIERINTSVVDTASIKASPSLLSFEKRLDSLQASYSMIKDTQERVINDIRQETNNNLDKISAWLSFWVAILALLGVFVPFAFQFFVYKREKDEIQKRHEEIKKLRDQYQTEFATLNIRLLASSYTSILDLHQLSDNLQIVDIEHRMLKNILVQLKEIQNSLKHSDDSSITTDRMISICAILAGILRELNSYAHTNRRIERKITSFEDYLRTEIGKLSKLSYTTDEDFSNLLCELMRRWEELCIQ